MGVRQQSKHELVVAQRQRYVKAGRREQPGLSLKRGFRSAKAMPQQEPSGRRSASDKRPPHMTSTPIMIAAAMAGAFTAQDFGRRVASMAARKALVSARLAAAMLA